MSSDQFESIVSSYYENGYFFPIEILAPEEVRHYRESLESVEARFGERFQRVFRHSPHLLANWAWDLVHNRKILDVVEAILGPDILCWDSTVFTKEALSPGFISWHQDITYWGLDSDDVCTAWLALSPSTFESGCMQVVPASHTSDVLPHRDTFADKNMLSRGQELAVDVNEDDAVNVVLRPGQASLHHVKIFHGSKPNRSGDRRIGFAVRYMSSRVRQSAGSGDAATLVRGKDLHGNFKLANRPHLDYAPDVIAYHAALQKSRHDVLMRQV